MCSAEEIQRGSGKILRGIRYQKTLGRNARGTVTHRVISVRGTLTHRVISSLWERQTINLALIVCPVQRTVTRPVLSIHLGRQTATMDWLLSLHRFLELCIETQNQCFNCDNLCLERLVAL